MKRLFITVLIAACTFSNIMAQEKDSISAPSSNMIEIFKSMPDSIIPYLSKNNRLDMIDFKASDMEAKITNKFGNQSVLDSISSKYLYLRLSPTSTVEMRVISSDVPSEQLTDGNGEHIIEMTFYVGSTHKEKVIKRYTLNWCPIENK